MHFQENGAERQIVRSFCHRVGLHDRVVDRGTASRHQARTATPIRDDARRDDAKWNSTAKVATEKGEQAWTVEMAIPLKEIEADLALHKTWGLQMARHRPRMEEKRSYQWSPTFWYKNTMPVFFGELELK